MSSNTSSPPDLTIIGMNLDAVIAREPEVPRDQARIDRYHDALMLTGHHQDVFERAAIGANLQKRLNEFFKRGSN